MARKRLGWILLVLLAGCSGIPVPEGVTSTQEDNDYWSLQREKCGQLPDDIAQKKCLDKVENDHSHGAAGRK